MENLVENIYYILKMYDLSNKYEDYPGRTEVLDNIKTLKAENSISGFQTHSTTLANEIKEKFLPIAFLPIAIEKSIKSINNIDSTDVTIIGEDYNLLNEMNSDTLKAKNKEMFKYIEQRITKEDGYNTMFEPLVNLLKNKTIDEPYLLKINANYQSLILLLNNPGMNSDSRNLKNAVDIIKNNYGYTMNRENIDSDDLSIIREVFNKNLKLLKILKKITDFILDGIPAINDTFNYMKLNENINIKYKNQKGGSLPEKKKCHKLYSKYIQYIDRFSHIGDKRLKFLFLHTENKMSGIIPKINLNNLFNDDMNKINYILSICYFITNIYKYIDIQDLNNCKNEFLDIYIKRNFGDKACEFVKHLFSLLGDDNIKQFIKKYYIFSILGILITNIITDNSFVFPINNFETTPKEKETINNFGNILKPNREINVVSDDIDPLITGFINYSSGNLEFNINFNNPIAPIKINLDELDIYNKKKYSFIFNMNSIDFCNIIKSSLNVEKIEFNVLFKNLESNCLGFIDKDLINDEDKKKKYCKTVMDLINGNFDENELFNKVKELIENKVWHVKSDIDLVKEPNKKKTYMKEVENRIKTYVPRIIALKFLKSLGFKTVDGNFNAIQKVKYFEDYKSWCKRLNKKNIIEDPKFEIFINCLIEFINNSPLYINPYDKRLIKQILTENYDKFKTLDDIIKKIKIENHDYEEIKKKIDKDLSISSPEDYLKTVTVLLESNNNKKKYDHLIYGMKKFKETMEEMGLTDHSLNKKDLESWNKIWKETKDVMDKTEYMKLFIEASIPIITMFYENIHEKTKEDLFKRLKLLLNSFINKNESTNKIIEKIYIINSKMYSAFIGTL